MIRTQIAEHLRDLKYKVDFETGEVYNSRGKLCESRDNAGYKWVRTKYGRIYIHQIIFYFYHGYLPKMIDHIDRDKNNNSIKNLRHSNPVANNQNRTCKGYYYNKKHRKYYAQIESNGKGHYLGCFDTAEEARQSYLTNKPKYHKII